MEEKLKKKVDRLKIVKLILIVIVIIETLMITVIVACGIVDRIELKERTRGMEECKADAYNQKFQSYTGANVKGTSVKNLYSVVRNHNTTVSNEGLKVKVKFKSEAITPEELDAEKAKILERKSYKVEVPRDGYDPNTSYITKIEITEI